MDLLLRWSEPRRAYHGLGHLEEVLQRLDQLDADGEAAASDPAVRLAAWFHDAVHDGEPGRDERRSADMARAVLTALDVPATTAERVADLVLRTVDHAAGDDEGAAVLCDADLGVLGGDPAAYARYAAAVRREYAHVDTATFRRGRAAVLRALLARRPLFATAAGRARWESPARANLAAEIAALTSGGDDGPRGGGPGDGGPGDGGPGDEGAVDDGRG
jgi:predicted metal-dependent HD superfamily phosphohydrolase